VVQRTGSVAELLDCVAALNDGAGRSLLIGISGFGGAGKSTLAADIARQLPGSALIAGDDFIRTRPCTGRSSDWSCMDFDRLRGQVLEPVRSGDIARYQSYDWEKGRPGPWVSLDGVKVVIVEGLGLFQDGLSEAFDLRVWIDVDLESATQMGMWRDEHVFDNPQVELWEQVWMPNDADFLAKHRPDLAADVLYSPAPLPLPPNTE
jgi:uridine kinase